MNKWHGKRVFEETFSVYTSARVQLVMCLAILEIKDVSSLSAALLIEILMKSRVILFTKVTHLHLRFRQNNRSVFDFIVSP